MQFYTLEHFAKDFPDEKACLHFLCDSRYTGDILCTNCGKPTKHHLIGSRKALSCDQCRLHIHPLVGTIFEATTTSLQVWSLVIHMMINKPTVTIKEIKAESEVAHKTARRMGRLIR